MERSDAGSTSAGALYAVAAYVIWGIAPVYWKALPGVPTSQILAHRVLWSCVFGLLLLLVIASSRRGARSVSRDIVMRADTLGFLAEHLGLDPLN